MERKQDFKKEWESIKSHLAKFAKETSELAKKGEEELGRFSQRTKLHWDTATVSLKKERLCYLIGREYIRSQNKGQPSANLNELLEEYKKLDTEEKSLKRKLNTKTV